MKHKVILTAALAAVLAGQAAGQWRVNGAPVSTAPYLQGATSSSITIAPDGQGGALIAWEDMRANENDIYAQRINPNGTSKWTANGVAVCIVSGTQYAPSIAGDGTGGAIIAWYDYRFSPADIFAQRLNGTGSAQWTSGGIAICDTIEAQGTVKTVSDGSGGAIFVWIDARTGISTYDLYAQRVNSTGAAQWTRQGVALCTATGSQALVDIATDGSGAIVVWADERGGTTSDDIYVRKISYAGVPLWTANGVAMCTSTNTQTNPVITSDGANAAIMTWQDYRNSNWDIYAGKVSSGGVVQWLADGTVICTSVNEQSNPAIASDGAGGAIITWVDARTGWTDIYAQRINSSGTVLWTADGVVVCSATNNQSSPKIIVDGQGGAIITWIDNRSGSGYDIYAQRLDASGVRQWNTHSGADSLNGLAICTSRGNQRYPVMTENLSGGAIIAWGDERIATDADDIYAQRIGYDGKFSEPEIVSVLDVPNDQGGLVNVIWKPSGLDAYPDTSIAYYSVWRSLTGAKLDDLKAGGVPRIEPSDLYESFQGPGYCVTELDGKSYAWEWLANLTWHHYLSQWSYLAPTTCDSGPSGRVMNHYMVSAQTDNPIIYWDSEADSGYSVDNVAPTKSLLLVGQQLKGPKADIRLDWNRETVADLWRYGVYRDVSSGFTPGPGNLVCYSDDTTETDAPTEACWYKVTALDVHGNEGAPSNEWYYDGSLSAQLSMFSAMELEDGRVSVRWRTESEENCLRWEVERSDAPGSTYLALGSVPGQGSTSQPTDYRYDDESELAPRTYYYRLGQVDIDGGKRYFGPVSLSYQWRVPAEAGIAGARPNPFNQTTTISYQITRPGSASLKVYNVYGQLVRTLETGQKPAGYHRARWDGRNDNGEAVSAGVYFVRLEGSGVASSSARVAVVR